MEKPRNNCHKGFPGFTLIELTLAIAASMLLVSISLGLVALGWLDIKRSRSSAYDPLVGYLRDRCAVERIQLLGPKECLQHLGELLVGTYTR